MSSLALKYRLQEVINSKIFHTNPIIELYLISNALIKEVEQYCLEIFSQPYKKAECQSFAIDYFWLV